MTTVGEQFARALAAKDFDRVAELLRPDQDVIEAVVDSWMRVLCSGFRPVTPE